jgi:uncharacterized membrane protein YbhN (UPF0104 family)
MQSKIKMLVGLLLVILCLWLVLFYFDWNILKDMGILIVMHPALLIFMIFVYLQAFFLRAYAWYLYMQKRVLYKVCLSGVFYSMLFNHLLPFKGGDLVRIGIVVLQNENKMKKDEVIHSVLVMRFLDVFILAAISACGGLLLFQNVFIARPFVYIALLAGGLLAFIFLIANKCFKDFYTRHWRLLKAGLIGKQGFYIVSIVIISWFLEGIVLFGVLMDHSNPITWLQAVWVNSLTVGGQFFQITPGGLATYEAMMSFGLKALNVPYATGLAAAVVTHLFKFIFSFIVGIIAFTLHPLDVTRIRSLLKERGFS